MKTWIKTKIVATMGPACASVEILESMIDAGLDVARINSSHGKYEDHQKIIDINIDNLHLNNFKIEKSPKKSFRKSAVSPYNRKNIYLNSLENEKKRHSSWKK
jgi:hypothetical protein